MGDFETGNPPEGWESEGQLRIGEMARKGRINHGVTPARLA